MFLHKAIDHINLVHNINIPKLPLDDSKLGSNTDHNLIKLYFDKYPLMTTKYFNYLSYLEGTNYLGKRLTKKEIIKIQAIKTLLIIRQFILIEII